MSVYTSGDELIAGENDISVLVQDAAGSPLLDAQIDVSAAREGAVPGTDLRGREADSDNKLLHSASIDLPAAGAWLVRVGVQHDSQSASVTFPTRAAVHTTGPEDWWPYFVFPGFGLLLLAIYFRRAHRRHAFVREQIIETTAAH